MDNKALTHILDATEDFKVILKDERNKAIRTGGTGAILKVGDTVLWSHGWCSMPIKETVVLGIEHVVPGNKYGEPVKELAWSLVQDSAIVTVASGLSWAYGYQIAPINEAQKEVA